MNVQDLISALVGAASGPTPERSVVAVLEGALTEADGLLEELALPDELVGSVLYRSPLVTVMAHVWPPGMVAPPHEHGMWSVVASLRGTEGHRIWESSPTGEPRTIEVVPGKVLALDTDAVHAVDNPGDDYAVSIHVYGGDLGSAKRRGWSPETGEVIPMSPHFLVALAEIWNHKQKLETAPITKDRTVALLRETIAEIRDRATPEPTRTPDGVAYDDRGSGRPIVFVHGLTFDRHAWDPIIERLQQDYRCVALDLPGHGETTLAGNHDAAVRSIASVIDHLDLRCPLLVGHSAGAVMSALYAADHPVAGILDVDQPLLAGRFAAMLQSIAGELRSEAFPRCWERFEGSLGYEHLTIPMRSHLLVHHVVKQDVVLAAWDWLLTERPDALQADIDARLMRITAPVLAIHGTDLGPGYAAWLAAATHGPARVETWAGSGHFPHLACPERFVATVQAFAREVF
jgi:pimeloyl-ACP methyl ester carboxylesterase/predicted metal-dependent enzyme (double-stranded beta helix superfamily)